MNDHYTPIKDMLNEIKYPQHMTANLREYNEIRIQNEKKKFATGIAEYLTNYVKRKCDASIPLTVARVHIPLHHNELNSSAHVPYRTRFLCVHRSCSMLYAPHTHNTQEFKAILCIKKRRSRSTVDQMISIK